MIRRGSRRTPALRLVLAVPVLATTAMAGAACALFEAPRALAQEDGLGAPKTPGKEPRRVLETLVAILEATHKNDPKPALKGLGDPHWAVRQFAAVRLGALGLPSEDVRAMIELSHAGLPAPAAGAAPVAAAEKWAQAFKPEAAPDDGQPAPTPGDEGMRIYSSLVRTELSLRKAPPKDLVKIVCDLPAYAEAAGDARAATFAAREVASMVDTEVLLKDLGVKTVNEAVEGNGKRVFEWVRQNGRFLYFHPGDHGLRLDAGARSANESTDDHRAKHPWANGEGPDAPANPKKKEVR